MKRQGILTNRDGRINLVTLFLLLVLAAGVYLVVMFAPAYMEKSKLQAKVEAVGNMAHRVRDEEQLRRELVRETELLGLDLSPENIKIERDPRGEWISFEINYAREIELVPFGHTVLLQFDVFHRETL